MDTLTDFLCPDVAAICVHLSAYPFPHTRQLVLTSDLYLRAFAKANPTIVQAYVDEIIKMVESGEFLYRYNPTSSGVQYLSWILAGLFPGYSYTIRVTDYAAFYTALFQDGIDVSALPKPEEEKEPSQYAHSFILEEFLAQ